VYSCKRDSEQPSIAQQCCSGRYWEKLSQWSCYEHDQQDNKRDAGAEPQRDTDTLTSDALKVQIYGR